MDSVSLEQLLRETMSIMDKAFAEFDADKCGQITFQQLSRKLALLGFRDQEKLQHVFRSVDRKQSGSLEFPEFLMLMYFWNDVGPHAYEIIFRDSASADTINRSFLLMEECYIRYDKDRTRRLNHDEFEQFMAEQLPAVSATPDASHTIRAYFPSTKPYLRFSEFLFMLYKLLLPKPTATSPAAPGPDHMMASAAGASPGRERGGSAGNASAAGMTTADKNAGGGGGAQQSTLWKKLVRAFEAMERDFDRFDADHNQCIDLAELTQGLSSARPSSELIDIMGRLESYFQEVDLDGSGAIDFFEFMYLMYLMIQNGAYRDIIHNPADAGAVKDCLLVLRACYSKYDRDGSRRLDRSELHAFLIDAFSEVPPRADELFTKLQSSPQRPHIDFCRFMRLLYEVVLPEGKFVSTGNKPAQAAPRPQTKMVQSFTGTPTSGSKRLPRVDPLDTMEVVKGEMIGQGGFGCVYKGNFRGHIVAAKYVRENASPEVAEETEKEVQLMRQFDHPNIVYLVGACTVMPNICIVTEFCQNGSLFDCIHKQRLQFDNAALWRIARETAVGLLVLHEMNPPVIHRDVKSLNVLLDENFTVKICDFGLSKVMSNTIQVQTRGVGTPQWTAPEVLSSGNYGTPSDVYSYGILLWEMWHRQVPYGNMDANQIVLGVVVKKTRPPISRKCPKSMAMFMTWCWHDDPHQRPNFRQVIQHLDTVQKQVEAGS